MLKSGVFIYSVLRVCFRKVSVFILVIILFVCCLSIVIMEKQLTLEVWIIEDLISNI